MTENQDIFQGLGVEVKLNDPSDFLKVKETLTRIGDVRQNRLFQNTFILHKRGRYAIMHYKELLDLDGKDIEIFDDDLAPRNTTIDLLVEWNLIKLVNPEENLEPKAPLNKIKIVSYKDKSKFELIPEYVVGGIKKTNRNLV